MALIDKFASISIPEPKPLLDADNVAFCEAHQKCYNTGINLTQRLGDIVKEANSIQVEIPGQVSEYPQWERLDRYGYFPTYGILDSHDIAVHIYHAKEKMIQSVLLYLSDKYNFRFDMRYAEKAAKDILGDMQFCDKASPDFHYQEITDWLYRKMDGKTFKDFAFQIAIDEFTRKTWDTWTHTPAWNQKKNVITIQGYGLRGEDLAIVLSYYETGEKECSPKFSDLADSNSGCTCKIGSQKVESVRLFKGARADIRFKQEMYAREFAEKFCLSVDPTEE